eukprot:4834697-Amphidinium_carterae.1
MSWQYHMSRTAVSCHVEVLWNRMHCCLAHLRASLLSKGKGPWSHVLCCCFSLSAQDAGIKTPWSAALKKD